LPYILLDVDNLFGGEYHNIVAQYAPCFGKQDKALGSGVALDTLQRILVAEDSNHHTSIS
jgi:histidyl-tRNA synthetase